jgi:hypothetical protein
MGSKPSKSLINKKVIEPIEMDKDHSSNVSSTTKDDSLREISLNKEQKFQVLCLHGKYFVIFHQIYFLHYFIGKRTSGHILSFQTSAMRHHTKMNAVFLDAPYRATGEPDPGVLTFYPNLDYYEWYTSNDYSNVKVGIDKIMQMLDSQSFDAILGFSQGAQMATIVATLLERKNTNDKIKGIICIGGVAPRLQHLEPVSISFKYNFHLFQHNLS